MIKVYKNKHQHEAMKEAYRDADKQGYTIASTSWQDGKSGCLRFLLLGPLAFFWRPAGVLTVVVEDAPQTSGNEETPWQ